MRWFVLDMDEGALRIEASRGDAVRWWKDHQCTDKVVERYTYGPGYYDYVVGNSIDDSADAAIVREDKLGRYGINTPPDEIQPLFPYRDKPHERRED